MKLSDDRILDTNGYVRLRVAFGDWRYEHRVVWERLNGPIPPGYHVHHKNEVRDDNSPDNLVLRLGTDHNREHTTERHRLGLLDNRAERSGRWRGELDAQRIMELRDAGRSFRSIGRELGAAHNVIAHHYRVAKGAA